MGGLRGVIILGGLLALALISGGEGFHAAIHDLATTPADVTIIGPNAGDGMGRGASGDFNGDGIDDLLLSAQNATVNGKTFAGKAWVVFGSPTLAGTIDLGAAAPGLTVLGAESFDNLGVKVASGDFNGDGIDDLLLGARGADAADNAKEDAGEAYVIFGSETLSGTIDLFTTAPSLTVIGVDSGDEMGISLAVGNFNGDGIDDLLLGATGADAAANAKASAGEAYVIFGSLTLGGTFDLAANTPALTVLGSEAQDLLGRLASGDFNGDGVDDVLVSAAGADATANSKLGAGEAYVIFGSASLSGTIDLATAAPALSVLGADAGDTLGSGLASGDFNGDGIDDLLLGVPNANGATNVKTQAGEAYAIFGSSTLGGTRDTAVSPADFTAIGADQNDVLGGAVGSGDFRGDGADDLLLGANGAEATLGGKSDSGEFYAMFGSPSLSGTINLFSTPADRTVTGADSFDLLGVDVTSGDFNGDGLDDALMNASLADGALNGRADAGEAYVMFGACASGVDTDKDGTCDTFDLDDDSDGFEDAVEDGTPLCGNGINDDSFDDGDIDDGCVPGTQVGAYSEAQFDIGTGALDACGNNGWPADLQANNKLDIGDFNSFLFPLRGNGSFNKFGHPVPDPDDVNIARWNLQWGGVTASSINIGDLNALNPAVIAETARPPMFGGLPAFFTNVGNGVGGCPFAP